MILIRPQGQKLHVLVEFSTFFPAASCFVRFPIGTFPGTVAHVPVQLGSADEFCRSCCEHQLVVASTPLSRGIIFTVTLMLTLAGAVFWSAHQMSDYKRFRASFIHAIGKALLDCDSIF